MSKILSVSFPLIDYLYIFQSFEYEKWNFLKWSWKNSIKRNLQKKKRLVWTTKAIMLFTVSFGLLAIFSFWLVGSVSNTWNFEFYLLVVICFVVLANFSSIFLILAAWLIWPIETWQKYRVMKRAKAKRLALKNLIVVGVTGSFAKTSVKEMLYTILRKKFRVVKTPKSYNTDLSIARSLINDVKENTEVFIVEMDAYHKGDIARLSNLVKPDIGIITAIAPQHLERFKSFEELALSQFEIAVNFKDEKLILNADDKTSQRIASQIKTPKIWFGKNEKADFRAEKIDLDVNGTNFELCHGKDNIKIYLPLFGEHHVVNFTAAASIAFQLGMNLEQIASRAKWLMPTSHRLEIKKIGQMTIIDNSYNSNPTSYKTSFKLLESITRGEKVIITPGLIEQGKRHFEENKQMGIEAANAADKVVIIGENAKVALLDGLKNGGMKTENIYFSQDPKTAMEQITGFVKKDAVILIENDLPDLYV